MELYSEEHFNYLSDFYKIQEEKKACYLNLFFMLGINEHIFNLAVRIHTDYHFEIEQNIRKKSFLKTYTFSEVLPYDNFGIESITIHERINQINSFCSRKKNRIEIYLIDFSFLTIVHELNHIFDFPYETPTNNAVKLFFFQDQISLTELRYKTFVHSLYLSSDTEIKTRTIEFFAYLLVNHYIFGDWNQPLNKSFLLTRLTDSTFYNDAIHLKNASFEVDFIKEHLITLIAEIRHIEKLFAYRKELILKKKGFRYIRLMIFKICNRNKKNDILNISDQEIEQFITKYNHLFRETGDTYLRRFNKIIFAYEKMRTNRELNLTRQDIKQALLRIENCKNKNPQEFNDLLNRICQNLNIQ